MIRNMRKRQITDEDVSAFLEGRDPMERIVNFSCSYKDDFVKVYYRDREDNRCVAKEPFYPMLWARKSACEALCDGDRAEVAKELRKSGIWVKKLDVTDMNGKVVEKMVDGYTFLFYATKPMSYSDFLDFFKRCGNPVYKDKKNSDGLEQSLKERRQYVTVPPEEQHMIRTGKRMFKGYDDYNDLLRLIFDLETEGLDPKIHRIKKNGISFNRDVKYNGNKIPFEKICDVTGETEEEKNRSELQVIDEMFRIIYTFKPDIITAHNGENFDWAFVIERCNQLGTSIADMSAKYFDGDVIRKSNRESILKLGGEVERFSRTIVPSVIITDSLHAVRRAQATDSNFREYNLKYATKYLDLTKNNRVYVPGHLIDTTLVDEEEHYAFNNDNGDWYLYDPSCGKKFKFDGNTKRKYIPVFNNIADGYELKSGHYIVDRYLLDDLYECDKVEYALNGTDFMLCKIIPVNFQKVCTMGTASQWKSIMLAWSYENNLAIPYAPNTGRFTGGLSRLLEVGFVSNIIKLDYNSLYPSIILTWEIEDEMDLMGATLKLLNYVLTTRETHKERKKAAKKIVDSFEKKLNNLIKLSEEENLEFQKANSDFKIEDNRQASVKKLSNSFFGAFGSNNGSVYPWKSVACAERTTCTGRQSLRLMISWFTNIGYKPIVGDSFTEDTPLFIKYKDTGYIDIVPVSELIDESQIQTDELGREYDYSSKPFYVLCRSGWVEPSYIYRHKTDKDVYEVTDDDMMVEVTEDHSLFNDEHQKIKPSEINETTRLEYFHVNDEFDSDIVMISQHEYAIVDSTKLAKGEIDRIPLFYFNRADVDTRVRFYKNFMEKHNNNVKYSKTCIAGLQFLKKSSQFITKKDKQWKKQLEKPVVLLEN